MGRDIAIQISTGFADGPDIDLPSIRRKLEAIYAKAPITYALIGWEPSRWPTSLAEWLQSQGTEVYLWLPVFSGWNGLEPLIGPSGHSVDQSYRSALGERFDFGCPAHPANVAHILELFLREHASHSYDGVFLDKVRFPSFIDGMASVMTCFCPDCVSRFGTSRAFQIEDVTDDPDENPLGLTSYRDLCYGFEDDRVAALFAYKAQAVTQSMTTIVQWFRDHGLKVGFDLFAPFLSYFVGQDYATLLPLADFIKPMFYRMTNAPAGIPFEIDRYVAAFPGNAEDLTRRRQRLMRVLRTDRIDLDFINREIDGIRRLSGDTKVLAGFEINRNDVAPVAPSYVAENVSCLDADGIALSWDLRSTPDDNLQAVRDNI